MTPLRLPKSLKIQLFALLDAGHFQVAKGGSIQRANQHPGGKRRRIRRSSVASMHSGGVAGLAWNQWQLSPGIGGRLAMESVAGLAWNTHAGVCGENGIAYSEDVRNPRKQT